MIFVILGSTFNNRYFLNFGIAKIDSTPTNHPRIMSGSCQTAHMIYCRKTPSSVWHIFKVTSRNSICKSFDLTNWNVNTFLICCGANQFKSGQSTLPSLHCSPHHKPGVVAASVLQKSSPQYVANIWSNSKSCPLLSTDFLLTNLASIALSLKLLLTDHPDAMHLKITNITYVWFWGVVDVWWTWTSGD